MATNTPSSTSSVKSSPSDLDAVRKRVRDGIVTALRDDRRANLIEALPATGKSRGLVEAISRTGKSATILTLRGRKEQYDQYETWCEKYNLRSKVIPSSYESCGSFNGDHGQDIEQKVKNLRNAGASVSTIHVLLDLPCEQGGDCDYLQATNFDPTNYDVLIGNPVHSYVKDYTQDRVVVFDEFPGEELVEEIKDVPGVVNSFLDKRNLPFDSYTDLLQNRHKQNSRQRALNQLEDIRLRNETAVIKQPQKTHSFAGLCVLVLLKNDDLGNGWQYAILGDGKVGAFDQQEKSLYILNPPELPDNVIGLDGTPTKAIWNLVLGFYGRRRMDHQQILSDRERARYIGDLQNLQIIQTTTVARHYMGVNQNPERDVALLHEIDLQHTGKKGLITSKGGKEKIGEYDGFDPNGWEVKHYNDLRGSNALSDVDVGVVIGSPHYGDEFVQRWAAFAGTAAKAVGQGMERSYGGFGNRILRHMREQTALQAIFRFARNGNGAIVYVDTAAIPDWVPVEDRQSEVFDKRSKNQLEVIRSLGERGSAKASEIAEELDLSPQYIRQILNDKGFVSKESAEGRGNPTLYVDEGINQMNPYGEVDLPTPTGSVFRNNGGYSNYNRVVSKNPASRGYRFEDANHELHYREQRLDRQMQVKRRYWDG